MLLTSNLKCNYMLKYFKNQLKNCFIYKKCHIFVATCPPPFPFQIRALKVDFFYAYMLRNPYNKPALTYAQQIQQLKDRGLIIENDSKAVHLLENLSYYRLSAYWYPLLSEPKSAHQFKPSSSFNRAFKLYCFDREFRKIISAEIEKIEVSVRAKMIYILSHNHGPFWYSNRSLFSNNRSFDYSIRN